MEVKRGDRFHNGREMRAEDVKFVLQRAANPETKHPHRARYAAIADIIVKDDYTITLRLKDADANFLVTLALQGSVIYPREAAETLKTQPIGTGPFTLAEWVRGDRIVLARNKDYHVKGLPYLDRVTYRFIPDPNSALAALRAGDIDASLFGLGPESVAELQKDSRFQVILGDTTNDAVFALKHVGAPGVHEERFLRDFGDWLGHQLDAENGDCWFYLSLFRDAKKSVALFFQKLDEFLVEAGYEGLDDERLDLSRWGMSSSASPGADPDLLTKGSEE